MSAGILLRLSALALLLASGCAGGDPPPGAPPPGAPPEVVLPIMAARGDAEAQVSLGWMYQTGQGFARDYNEAAYWYREAADQGNGLAQYSLAELYARGLGVRQDFGQAARWHRQAAEAGNVSSQFRLAYFYEQGLGVPRDYDAAARWYSRAALGSRGVAGLPPNLERLLGTAIIPPTLIPPPRETVPDTSSASAAPIAEAPPSVETGEAMAAFPVALDGHWVHIASFRTRAAAALHWDTLRDSQGAVLAGLRSQLMAIDLGADPGDDRGAWIRLYAGPLDDSAAAAALCRQLRSRAIYCAMAQ